jgi:diguanylate cyclase (GGDEF)-like protein
MERLRDGVGRGEDIALAVLDVDRFKEVNDAYGRETGDRLLQVLAALLAKETPALPHRISGDEFAVLLPDLSLEQAFLRMEALRGRVQGATGLFGVPDGREVTITIGVAQYPRDAKDADGLVKVADAALLAGKESGRNSVGLPPNEEMVMKSCYYPAASVRKLKMLAERLGRKESHLLREALNDVLRKYDVPRES